MRTRLFEIVCLIGTALPAVGQIHYVSPSGSHIAPFDSWATAATNLKVGVEAAADGDKVRVAAGSYEVVHVVAITNDIVVESAAGHGSTLVYGEGLGGFELTDATVFITGFTFSNFTYGGAVQCDGGDVTISNCVFTHNAAPDGGGMSGGTAVDCVFVNNRAKYDGGGMYAGIANRCSFRGNEAGSYGGGSSMGTAHNSSFFGNSAGTGGGGLSASTAVNCTIVGNSAGLGGGLDYGYATNCVVWFNTAQSRGDDLIGTEASHSCSPDLAHGVSGNITNNPLLSSGWRISPDSPCRGAGSALYASGTDLDGEVWFDPPSMGCDENYGPGSLGGPIELSLVGVTQRVVASEFPLTLSVIAEGEVRNTTVTFGDGTGITNQPVFTKRWDEGGDYDLVLTAYNDTYPAGLTVTQTFFVVPWEDHAIYVSEAMGSDEGAGTSWAVAKKTIQSGVLAQDLYGGSVVVTNGVYALTSQVVIDRDIRLSSANGPGVTVLDGGNLTRCLDFENCKSVVRGFTVRNGNAVSGGGIRCQSFTDVTVENCDIRGNRASQQGGGMHGGTAVHCRFSGNIASGGVGGALASGKARNCLFLHNTAQTAGGGAWYSTLVNSTISHNTAPYGGGVADCTIVNSVVWSNSGNEGMENTSDPMAIYSCSPELNHGVQGNITLPPDFRDAASGDYRLSNTSPCIDTGASSASMTATDLDGLPRTINGRVDMGAYEWPPLAVTGLARPIASNGTIITWPSFSNAHYTIYSSTNLAFGYDIVVGDRVPATPPENTFTDMMSGVSHQSYRLELEPLDGP